MTHDVFAPIEEPGLVVKRFGAGAGREAACEWDALRLLSGSGIAPEPVAFDPAEPAVVVMTRVDGERLTADRLELDHAHAIAAVHRRVHAFAPESRRAPAYAGILATRGSLVRGDLPDEGLVGRAWREARTWITGADLSPVLRSDGLRFCRGDPNLGNYLWTGDRPVLVDWENSGDSDAVLEVADMAEHASTRALGDEFWSALAVATGLDAAERARLPDARRLMACFWLVLIADRTGRGLPTTVTLEEQALRTLAVVVPQH